MNICVARRVESPGADAFFEEQRHRVAAALVAACSFTIYISFHIQIHRRRISEGILIDMHPYKEKQNVQCYLSSQHCANLVELDQKVKPKSRSGANSELGLDREEMDRSGVGNVMDAASSFLKEWSKMSVKTESKSYRVKRDVKCFVCCAY
ncbi:hypothetical protein EVAR_67850_1 [Eumeta japonica]|uniref:Uncharacterized protein n=1 Tax=Eumeta variegata TaxID=151549 RepID=A0A4C1SFC0_EUMVA|nr:hypothetical protein EVAR_67850_1 [Eumeta japonica]